MCIVRRVLCHRRFARPFSYDIRPIVERLSQLQWVNAGFAAAFGWKALNDFSTEHWLSRLANNTPVEQELCETIANHFRVFERDSWSPIPWPWLYGDAMNIPPAQTRRHNVALTGTQLKMLQQWAASEFEADYWTRRHPSSVLQTPFTRVAK